MSNERTIARPYATAAFDVAQQTDEVANWLGYLGLASSLKTHEDVMRFLASPMQSVESVTKAFDKIVSANKNDASLNDLISGVSATLSQPPKHWKQFIHVLHKNDKLSILPHIGDVFIEKVQASNAVMPVTLISAQAISEAEALSLTENLSKRLGKAVDIMTETDASLIGGAIIKVADTVIDGSVKGKLDAMRQSLTL